MKMKLSSSLAVSFLLIYTSTFALEKKPDLILLDVQMPLMDGVQVLAFLGQHESTRSIPIIIVTTIGRERDKELLTGGGARTVISKPIDALELVRTVRRLVGA